jgi:hypothetical protein
MDRRSFLGLLVGGVATAAAVRTWPFRVYSFSTEINTELLWNGIPVIADPTRLSGRVDFMSACDWGRVRAKAIYDSERMIWVFPTKLLGIDSPESSS